MHKQIAATVAACAFLIGTAGAAVILPGIATAADPSASPTTTVGVRPAASASTSAGTSGVAGAPGIAGCGVGHGGPRGLDADDLTAAAKALGMTEADLTTALHGGQSAAAVAKTRGVDVQKVIDAVVASDKAEIAAAVKAGTVTQAQADQQLANLTAHVTDEVNGVAGGPGGHGMRGGPGSPDGRLPAPSPAATSGTSG